MNVNIENDLLDTAQQALADTIQTIDRGLSMENVFENGLAAFVIITVLILAAVFLFDRLLVRIQKRQDTSKKAGLRFLFSLARAIVFVLAGIGISMQITPLKNLSVGILASSGVLAIIVGLASQDVAANLTSGMFILLFKPFTTGDLVTINAVTGTVEDITLRHTVIKTFANSRLIIPNSVINTSTLENFTIGDLRTCNFLEIAISYDSDAELARRIMADEIVRHPFFLDMRTQEQKEGGDPPVTVLCTALGDFSVTLRAAIWTADRGAGYRMLCDLRLSIKKRFDAEGVEIPYPHRTLVYKDGGRKA